MSSFWHGLPKPFFVLAPLANVTDAAFRRIIAKYSRPAGPAVFWTEFVSADGLCHPQGREKLLSDLMYTEAERPIVAQLFGSKPEKMEQAAKLCAELGFDGIDINMGCPDKTIEKQGAGAALIKNPKLARELIQAAKKGVSQQGATLPVSVKTRLGYNRDELETWLPELLAEQPAALTLHCRTRKEMSKVPARWERVAAAVKLRDQLQANLAPEDRTLIIGNGDVKDLTDAKQKANKIGADGIMLGRAIFGNPWLFSAENNPELSRGIKERLQVMLEHTKLFEELLGGKKSFALMKKHYKAYVEGWGGAKELRERLMLAETAGEVEVVVAGYLHSAGGGIH